MHVLLSSLQDLSADNLPFDLSIFQVEADLNK